MDCDTLSDPANGQVSHSRTTLGQTATYSCNTGYNLVGDSTRMCQAMGHTHTHTAGHYVPATAQVIVESNSIYAQNLKGIAIGNGWVDPYTQYGAYAQVQD